MYHVANADMSCRRGGTADALRSGRSLFTGVEVQILSSAPIFLLAIFSHCDPCAHVAFAMNPCPLDESSLRRLRSTSLFSSILQDSESRSPTDISPSFSGLSPLRILSAAPGFLSDPTASPSDSVRPAKRGCLADLETARTAARRAVWTVFRKRVLFADLCRALCARSVFTHAEKEKIEKN